jgi:hypothetical protein
MGSPLSPVLADLYMEKMETNIKVQNTGNHIKFSAGRPLEVRVNEHKRNWQKMKREKEEGLEAATFSSLLACHAVEQDHKVLWDDVNILAKEPNTKRRKIHEAAAMYL